MFKVRIGSSNNLSQNWQLYHLHHCVQAIWKQMIYIDKVLLLLMLCGLLVSRRPFNKDNRNVSVETPPSPLWCTHMAQLQSKRCGATCQRTYLTLWVYIRGLVSFKSEFTQWVGNVCVGPGPGRLKTNVSGLMWWSLSWERWRILAFSGKTSPPNFSSFFSAPAFLLLHRCVSHLTTVYSDLPSVSPHWKAILFLRFSYFLSDPNASLFIFLSFNKCQNGFIKNSHHSSFTLSL